MQRTLHGKPAHSPSRRMAAAVRLLAACAVSGFLAACAARVGEEPAAESAGPPALEARMVLNRALFLSWTEAPEEDFGCYEVYGGPAGGALPARPMAVLDEADHCYLQVRGLEPETEYAFRIRLLPASGGDGLWSAPVRATTLRDGYPEGTPPGAVRVPTLMYHHVRPLATFQPGADPGGWYSTENFERDLAWMKDHGVHTVTTADILDGRLPENPVFLTFDDGYTDFLDYAVPLLVRYGFQAANAIVTQLTAGQSTWALPEWPLDSLMTWPQIRRCLQAGMEIGGHTQTHVNLYARPDQLGQIRGSFDDLADALGFPPLYFCYPFGMGGHDFVDAKIAARDAGYRLATATWPPSDAVLASDPFFFPRRFANQADSLQAFLAKAGLPAADGTEPGGSGGAPQER